MVAVVLRITKLWTSVGFNIRNGSRVKRGIRDIEISRYDTVFHSDCSAKMRVMRFVTMLLADSNNWVRNQKHTEGL